tara:strand:- start:6166 stop:6363 length:198 start_codon:yes stop_codon:yes gene_type:complete
MDHLNYHPIMGILIFIFSLIIAYFIGKIIAKKNIFKWKKNESTKTSPNTDLGDANSPDAPWMKKK